MEKLHIDITCSKHPSETVQRVSIDAHADKHLYCPECILQQEHDMTCSKPQFTTFNEFISSAAAFYLHQKDSATISSIPDEYSQAIVKKDHVLQDLTDHISVQKKKVESVFDEITKEVLAVITERKNDYLYTLDQQVLNLRHWYVFIEKQLKKSFPSQEDIPQLFPSKEDLEDRLSKISNIIQLQAFVRNIKEDIHEDEVNTGPNNLQNYTELQKEKLNRLSKKLSNVEVTKPLFSVEESEMSGLRKRTQNCFKSLFENMFVVSNTIVDVLHSQANLDSKIIIESEYSLIQEWLPEKYKSMVPQLLFRSSRDGSEPKTFHTLCDNKGPTITLVKTGIYDKVIGGFADKSWHSNDTFIPSDEAFLFSVTSKFKCPILESGKPKALYGGSKDGPVFGSESDLALMNPLTGNICNKGSYQDSQKLLKSDAPNINPFGFGNSFATFNFKTLEIEVYVLK